MFNLVCSIFDVINVEWNVFKNIFVWGLGNLHLLWTIIYEFVILLSLINFSRTVRVVAVGTLNQSIYQDAAHFKAD